MRLQTIRLYTFLISLACLLVVAGYCPGYTSDARTRSGQLRADFRPAAPFSNNVDQPVSGTSPASDAPLRKAPEGRQLAYTSMTERLQGLRAPPSGNFINTPHSHLNGAFFPINPDPVQSGNFIALSQATLRVVFQLLTPADFNSGLTSEVSYSSPAPACSQFTGKNVSSHGRDISGNTIPAISGKYPQVSGDFFDEQSGLSFFRVATGILFPDASYLNLPAPVNRIHPSLGYASVAGKIGYFTCRQTPSEKLTRAIQQVRFGGLLTCQSTLLTRAAAVISSGVDVSGSASKLAGLMPASGRLPAAQFAERDDQPECYQTSAPGRLLAGIEIAMQSRLSEELRFAADDFIGSREVVQPASIRWVPMETQAVMHLSGHRLSAVRTNAAYSYISGALPHLRVLKVSNGFTRFPANDDASLERVAHRLACTVPMAVGFPLLTSFRLVSSPLPSLTLDIASADFPC